MKQYRRIYIREHGSIPLDEDGRTFDIHHLDGNRNNNDPSNLLALSIKDHYDLHYTQGDYNACWRIAQRMDIPLESKRFLVSEENKKRVMNGTHNFLGGDHVKKLVAEGKHHFCDSEFQRINNANRPKIVCEHCGRTISGGKGNYKQHLRKHGEII